MSHTAALAFFAALTLSGAAQGAATGPPLQLWQLDGEYTLGSKADEPLPVGSLQKPFVAQAWAQAHPGRVPELARCDERSHCWRPSGHGVLGLERALALSCNAYFLQLATETPVDVLAETLRAQGFVLNGALTPELAIGLPAEGATLTIAPEALLRAYRRLIRTPWTTGESVRQRVLLGLRDAALAGTARGVGQRGYWAKTGTIRALDGQALRTSGWALAFDDAGFGVLALLPRGTGRDAALALQPTLARLRPWMATTSATRPLRAAVATSLIAPSLQPTRSAALSVDDLEQRGVHVRLFDALRPQHVSARNLEEAPAAGSNGFVGGGARVALHPGMQLGPGLWELSLPEWGLVRRVKAALSVGGTDGRLAVVARLSAREYVQGVLLGEAPAAELHPDAGAAVLRFLLQGRRHTDADVCDLTHCAFFVGRGPRVAWLSAHLPVLLPQAPVPAGADASSDWQRVLELARTPGPSSWSSHCGGEPLSAFYVWGAGEHTSFACARHAAGSAPTWRRVWPAAALERALGGPVESARVDDSDGIWGLRVETADSQRVLRFDDAHRLLATELGWDALPSPARRVWRSARGFEVEGVGYGHRVGLCLAGPDGTRAAGAR